MIFSEKLNQFFSQFKLTDYKKDEILLRPDENPQYVYFVDSGFVRLYYVFEEGKELTLNIFKPGTFFPMLWAIANINNKYYFQTMTEAKIRKAPVPSFVNFLKQEPEVLFDFTRRILVGLNGVLTNMQYLLFGAANRRVLAAILLSAKRFGEPLDGSDKILIKLPLTHQDIAHLAGITRETASVEIEKLMKKDYICYHNRLIVLNDMKNIEEEIYMEDIEPLTAYSF